MADNSIECARAVIGICLRYPGSIAEAESLLLPSDFRDFKLCAVYSVILDLYGENVTPDMVTVVERLKSITDGLMQSKRYPHKKEKFGGTTWPFVKGGNVNFPSWIASLWEDAGTDANLHYYAKIVKSSSVREQIRQIARDTEQILSSSETPEEAIGEMEKRIFEISTQSTGNKTATLAQAVARYDERLELAMAGLLPKAKPYGLIDLDRCTTGGMHAGEYIILAARPSVGKTAMLLHIYRTCIKRGDACLVVTLEQPEPELVERCIASEGNLNMQRLRDAKLTPEDLDRYVETREKLASYPGFIHEAIGEKISPIVSYCRAAKLKSDIKVILIDYLQLITPDYRIKNGTGADEIGVVSKRLRNLAKELKIPVVVLAQINRDGDDDNNKPPRAKHLRGSGEIEQDADTIILMHRDDSIQKNDGTKIIDLIVAKQRNGPVGTHTVVFRESTLSYENLAHDPPGNNFGNFP